MKLRTKKVSVLALAATAAMAVGGIGAGSAHASLLTACTGSDVHGEGSSLQRTAQTVWVSRFNTNTNGGCTVSGRTPRVTYTTTSSGQCMNGKWGADGVATIDRSVHFCGTDDAPTTTQITNLNAQLRASVLSIPVAQAAIAILVNPPSGCSITSITPAALERVFNGTTTSWSTIATGTGCSSVPITRVVRNDSSGTSYQLKHYLFNQNGAAVCSASGRTTTTWAGLQDSTLNTVWPSVCDNYPSTGVKYSQAGCPSSCSGTNNGSGGGDEAKTVAATNGAIGYAALADARSVYTGTSQYKWVPLSVTVGGRLVSIDPSTNRLNTARAYSNCSATSGAYGSPLPSATSSWAGVYMTSPGSNYPLCTLTWDLASNNYTALWTSGLTPNGQHIATTVHDYLNYVNLTLGGVADALVTPNTNDYAALPSGGGGTDDVQAAAALGVSQING